MSTTDFQPAADRPSSEDFADLVACHLAGELDDGQRDRLNNVLMADPERRDEFVAFCLHANLIGACVGARLLDQEDLDTFCEDEGSFERNPQPQCASPAFVLFENTSVDSISRFSSGWPAAYLIATVVFIVGLTIGALVHVSQPIEYAGLRGIDGTRGHQSSIPNTASVVGRVTGMVDCMWEGTGFRVRGAGPANRNLELGNHNSLVRLGDCFALRSGLLEITYDTGATVILQGPVTYDVESSTGGYLAVGKLTAKLEKRSAVSGQRSEASNPQSLIPSPLFSVRTPTAIVTDLGTEFGVEVNEQGHTASYVFRGVVEVRPVAGAGSRWQPIRLGANQSVRVERSANGQASQVRPGDVSPAKFVRCEPGETLIQAEKRTAFHRWQTYREELRRDSSLMAYYDFQQNPGLPSVLANVAGNGDHACDGVVHNATWSDGRMPGKHALRFNGVDEYVEIQLPQRTEDLTLAAWVYVESLHDLCNSLLMSEKRSMSDVHWQLRAEDGAVGIGLGGGRIHHYQAAPAFDPGHLSRWRHVATVYDHAAAQVSIYVDGRLTDKTSTGTPVPLSIGRAWIAHWDSGDSANPDQIRNLRGKMDELAIFRRALSAEEIERMFEAGRVSGSEPRGSNRSVKPDRPQRREVEKH